MTDPGWGERLKGIEVRGATQEIVDIAIQEINRIIKEVEDKRREGHAAVEQRK